jgi:hypothetical protein
MKPAIVSHIREIDRLNQRGGRFLSIIDLLDAGTVDLACAAYLGAAILDGTSFLVGALPGGAGKTTVMGALLNFVPPAVKLVAASEGVPAGFLEPGRPRHCLVCHEIGRGPYFAYLWGHDVQDFFRLPAAGHMAATNLHADDVDQAREIIVGGCGVPGTDFAVWPLFLFLTQEGDGWSGVRRRIGTAWEGPERLVYRHIDGAWEQVAEPRLGTPEHRAGVTELLEELRAAGKRRIADVREAVLRRFS